MTTIERKQHELADLIAEHRIVKVEMQAEHAACIAREDIPEYGIKAGERFDLVKSSFEGYAYIVRAGIEGHECSCRGFGFRHSCKHTKLVNGYEVARYYAHKAQAGTLVLEPVMRTDDEAAHVGDSLRSSEFEWASCYGCGLRVRHEGYCHKCA